MEHTRFVGLDIHKERISIAAAESGRSGAVQYLGEVRQLIRSLSAKLGDRLGPPGRPLAFCYKGRPCAYGVYRNSKAAAIGATWWRHHDETNRREASCSPSRGSQKL
jgi:hypothetical protein